LASLMKTRSSSSPASLKSQSRQSPPKTIRMIRTTKNKRVTEQIEADEEKSGQGQVHLRIWTCPLFTPINFRFRTLVLSQSRSTLFSPQRLNNLFGTPS